jgi:membrane protein YdbS with pleckstrin-like domain
MESNEIDKEINKNKRVIKILAFVFLLLGIAVVFIEYWFFYRNSLSQSIAGILLIGCSVLFFLVIFVFLNLKFDLFGLKKDKKRKRSNLL